ncbi:unnamed protein product [Owenia fusiformis]|uniref:Peptidase S1 domain-containing protein n=1 Tax=Owenia fusiformis TaxID=6347 RepID=A0A8S4NKC6_OWEFU|nr:unnamed protein product [Owenia fusiformis]
MIALLLSLVAAASAAPSEPVPAYFNPGPFIVNGDIADAHEFPHQLSLQSGTSHICGAVLTHPTWVITAAHCVTSSGYRVVAGATERNRYSASGQEQVSDVAEVIMHPDFVQDGSRGFPNDIALLRLATPINLNFARATIPLASGSTDFAGQLCDISGWGDVTAGDGISATYLRKATLSILSNFECGLYWSQIRQSYHICIYDSRDRQGSCQGDSGGPMTCSEGGQDVVAGVTSWGVVGCLGMPNVYTRVATYRSWLCSNSQGNVGC